MKLHICAALGAICLFAAAGSAEEQTPLAQMVENALSAAAPPAEPPGPRLWQNIHLGMTVDRVRELYPSEVEKVKYHPAYTELEDFSVTEKCIAEVNIHHSKGVVDKVVLRGAASFAGRCSDTVLTGLASKYGQPLAETASPGSIVAREGRIYVWNRDGVTMRFKRFTSGALSGGGLFRASWELTYTTVGEDLAL